jgi:hypothetical protein
MIPCRLSALTYIGAIGMHSPTVRTSTCKNLSDLTLHSEWNLITNFRLGTCGRPHGFVSPLGAPISGPAQQTKLPNDNLADRMLVSFTVVVLACLEPPFGVSLLLCAGSIYGEHNAELPN